MNNIILIGMPGSGKSTVGVLLAKLIGYEFIDADLIIQSRQNKKLYEIINEKGNDYFLRLENEVCASIDAQKTVIATGGSAVYGKEAMEHFKSIGKIIYLDVPLAELEKRVKNFATRGIMKRPEQNLADIFDERRALYEKWADVTVECTEGTHFQNAEKIISALKL